MDPAHRLVRVVEVRALCRDGRARDIRVAAGVSQAELGAAGEWDGSTISRWETGIHLPRPDDAIRYGALLEMLAATGRPAAA